MSPAAAIITPATSVSTLPSPWILSRREDLLWFHGSVVAGLALLAVLLACPRLDAASYHATHPAVLALLAWGVLLDGTHVFGTYARTWLAPDAASRAALPGPWSWGLLAVGPVLALIDAALPQSPSLVGHAGLLFRTFLLGAYLWAYWHLVRQHYGFLALYRRREAPPDRATDRAQDPGRVRRVGQLVARAEVVLLWAGCLHPFVRFSLGEGYRVSGLPLLVPTTLLTPLRLALDGVAVVVVLAAAATIVIGRRGRLGPAHLLIALVLGFHQLVFATLDNLLAITAVLTIFHNLQYHRIVWQYERGRGRRPMGSLVRYLALGVLFGALWYGPRILGVALVDGDLVRNLLLGLGWGVAFHHYFVDGKIWRVRRSQELGRALDRGAASATVAARSGA